MKVGEYCRTDKGKIGKIVHFEPRDKYPYSYDRVILDTEGHKRTTRNIIKCSPKIIDLIEVGDILLFEDNSICRITEITDNGYYLLKDYGGEQYYESKEWLSSFKSIITNEQIKSMEYKVKE